MSELNEAVIISAARTPVGKFLGSLKGFTAPELGAIAVRESVKRAGIKPEEVDEVIVTGKGASTDIIEGSAGAYLNAVNRFLLAGNGHAKQIEHP